MKQAVFPARFTSTQNPRSPGKPFENGNVPADELETAATNKDDDAKEDKNAAPAPEQIANAAIAMFEGNEQVFDRVVTGGRDFVAARTDLGRTAAGLQLNMLLLMDFTNEANERASAILTVLGALAGLLALLLAGALFWLRSTPRPLKEGTIALVAATNGQQPALTHQMPDHFKVCSATLLFQ